MNKVSKVILIICLLALICSVFVACNEDSSSDCIFDQRVVSSAHLKSKATCESPAVYYYSCTCGKNGEQTFTDGEALGHEFLNATCLKPSTCKRCGKTEGEALGHDYNKINVCTRCGNIKKKEASENQISASKFWDDLWASSNAVASSEIGEDEDVAITLNASASLYVKDNNRSYKSLDIGIELQVIYDLDGADSAIKLQLFNPIGERNILTLYFYVGDPYNIYIDFGDKKLVFGFDTGYNDEWAGIIASYFDLEMFGNDIDHLSLAKIIKLFTEDAGEAYNFNSFINTIISVITGASHFKLVDTVEEYQPVIEGILGIENIIGANGKLDFNAILKSVVITSFFTNVSCDEVDGVKKYSLDLVFDKIVESALSSIIENSNPGLGKIVEKTIFNITYDTIDGDISGLTVRADLKGLTYQDTDVNKKLFPHLEFNVHNLDIRGIDASKESAIAYFEMNGEYKAQSTHEVKIKLSSEGVTLHPSAASSYSSYAKNAADFVLDGDYEINILTNGDFYEDDLYALISLDKVSNGAAETAIKLVYNGQKLLMAFDETVLSANGQSVVEVLFNSEVAYLIDRLKELKILGEIYDADYLTESIKDAFFEVLADGSLKYVYQGDKVFSIDVDAVDLLKWLSDLLAVRIEIFVNDIFKNRNAESDKIETIDDEGNYRTKPNYRIRMLSFVNIANSVCNALMNTDDDVAIKLPYNKTLMEVLKSWFKLNGKNGTSDEWYSRIMAYRQSWFERFTDLGFYDGYEYDEDGNIKRDRYGNIEYKSYKILVKKDAEYMMSYALSERTYEDYVAAMTNKDKTPVSEEEYNAIFKKMDELFYDSLFSVNGDLYDHWYEYLFEGIDSMSVVIDAVNGLDVVVEAAIKDLANAIISINISESESVSKEDLIQLYSDVSESEEIVDLGEIILYNN